VRGVLVWYGGVGVAGLLILTCFITTTTIIIIIYYLFSSIPHRPPPPPAPAGGGGRRGECVCVGVCTRVCCSRVRRVRGVAAHSKCSCVHANAHAAEAVLEQVCVCACVFLLLTCLEMPATCRVSSLASMPSSRPRLQVLTTVRVGGVVSACQSVSASLSENSSV
jgi:hypothetical protein